MFIGREEELAQLKEFKKRKIAGIIVCCGRRRIGKSTLIEHFGEHTRFLEFYGLAPREQLTNKDQLDHFGELMGLKFNIPPMKFDNWNQALTTVLQFMDKYTIICFLLQRHITSKLFSCPIRGVSTSVNFRGTPGIFCLKIDLLGSLVFA